MVTYSQLSNLMTDKAKKDYQKARKAGKFDASLRECISNVVKSVNEEDGELNSAQYILSDALCQFHIYNIWG